MSLPGVLAAQYRKEMLSVLRDRRALLPLLLVPVVVLPALSLLVADLTRSGLRELVEEPARIAVAGLRHAPPDVAAVLEGFGRPGVLERRVRERGERLHPFARGLLLAALPEPRLALERRSPYPLLEAARATPPVVVTLLDDDEGDLPGLLSRYDAPYLEPALRPGARTPPELEPLARVARRLRGGDDFDAVLVIYPGFGAGLERMGARYGILELESEDHSRAAADKIARMMHVGELAVYRFREGGRVWWPAPERLNAGESLQLLPRLLPLFLVLCALLGGMHCAADLYAGERERRTLETLAATPAPPAALLAGKWLAVATCGLVAAFANVAAIALLGRVWMEQPVPATGPAEILTMLLPLLAGLSLLFAAILLMISAHARNQRQAHALMALLNILVLLPMLQTTLPGIRPEGALPFLPVVNHGLALRGLFTGGESSPPALLVLALSLAYALPFLYLAYRRIVSRPFS